MLKPLTFFTLKQQGSSPYIFIYVPEFIIFLLKGEFKKNVNIILFLFFFIT